MQLSRANNQRQSVRQACQVVQTSPVPTTKPTLSAGLITQLNPCQDSKLAVRWPRVPMTEGSHLRGMLRAP